MYVYVRCLCGADAHMSTVKACPYMLEKSSTRDTAYSHLLFLLETEILILYINIFCVEHQYRPVKFQNLKLNLRSSHGS